MLGYKEGSHEVVNGTLGPCEKNMCDCLDYTVLEGVIIEREALAVEEISDFLADL